VCTGLALSTISNRTNVDFDREITQRAQKLALLLLHNCKPRPSPRTLGHLIFAQGARPLMLRYTGIQLFWLPSTFYIRTRSDPDAMCRPHCDGTAALRKHPKAHGAMPNTASQAVSTTHLPCLTLESLKGAQEPGAAALLESE
jgi:hypothetical protein